MVLVVVATVSATVEDVVGSGLRVGPRMLSREIDTVVIGRLACSLVDGSATDVDSDTPLAGPVAEATDCSLAWRAR